VLTGITSFSAVDGLLWLSEGQLAFGKWQEERVGREFRRIDQVGLLFQAPVNELGIRWSRHRHAMRVRCAGRRFRVHFKSDLQIPDASQILGPAAQLSTVAGLGSAAAWLGGVGDVGEVVADFGAYKGAQAVGRVWHGVLQATAPKTPSRCPRCDAGFGCAARTSGCWCGAVQLSAEHRAQLAAEYEGCLCPGCLRELVPWQ